MFKLLRKLLIGVVLALVLVALFAYFREPYNRRYVVQLAEQLVGAVKREGPYPAWEGTVVVTEALDGDRVQVNTETSRGVVVRLAGVDAPEMPGRLDREGQPLAEESRAYLSSLVTNKAARMVIVGTDARKLPLVLLYIGQLEANEEMIKVGLAEATGEGLAEMPAKDRRELEMLEHRARKQKLKIWNLSNYVPPVEHRIRQQKSTGVASSTSATNSI